MIGIDGNITYGDFEVKVDTWNADDCPCPFSLLTEFKFWFKWWRRVAFEQETPRAVTEDMCHTTEWRDCGGRSGVVATRMREKIEFEILYAETRSPTDPTWEQLIIAETARLDALDTQRRLDEMIAAKRGPAIHIRNPDGSIRSVT